MNNSPMAGKRSCRIDVDSPHDWGKPCDICGADANQDLISTCSKCSIAREHVYCMRKCVMQVPEIWICEACQSSENLVLPIQCDGEDQFSIPATSSRMAHCERYHSADMEAPGTPHVASNGRCRQRNVEPEVIDVESDQQNEAISTEEYAGIAKVCNVVVVDEAQQHLMEEDTCAEKEKREKELRREMEANRKIIQLKEENRELKIQNINILAQNAYLEERIHEWAVKKTSQADSTGAEMIQDEEIEKLRAELVSLKDNEFGALKGTTKKLQSQIEELLVQRLEQGAEGNKMLQSPMVKNQKNEKRKARKLSEFPGRQTNSDGSSKSKPKKRGWGCKKIMDSGPETLADLPRKYKKKIADMGGGSDVKLVIQKPLYHTDLTPHPNRLSMPFGQLREKGFLTEEENAKLKRRKGKPGSEILVPVIDSNLNLWPMISLKRCDFGTKTGKVNSKYVLGMTWRDLVQENKLEEGDVVQLWSFRVELQPHFALVLVPKRRGQQ